MEKLHKNVYCTHHSHPTPKKNPAHAGSAWESMGQQDTTQPLGLEHLTSHCDTMLTTSYSKTLS